MIKHHKFTTFLILYLLTFYAVSANPKIIDGFLDLSNHDVCKLPTLSLDGKWEFYPNQLLTDKDFKNHKITNNNYINVPSVWNKQGYLYKNVHCATYRLRIKVVNKFHNIGFRFPIIYTAAKVFIDDNNIFSEGVPGKTKQLSVPAYHPSIVSYFVHESKLKEKYDTINLIIQVSNFHHYDSGIWERISIGNYDSILRIWNIELLITLIILGIFLKIAYECFKLSLLKDYVHSKVSLWFSIYMLCVIMYIIINNQKVILFIFPDIPFVPFNALIQISTFIFVLPLVLFLKHKFPAVIHNWLVKYMTVSSLIFVLIILTCDTVTASFLRIVIAVQSLILGMLLIFYYLPKAIKARLEGSNYALIGMIILVIAGINDFLYGTRIITTYYILGYGCIAQAIIQYWGLHASYSKTLIENQKLTSNLKNINETLEATIKERTQEILEKNEKLNQSYEELKELSTFKSGLMHMIVHDLKNPLNAILNLSEDKTITYAASTMNILVNNILDINKFEEAKIHLKLETVYLKKIVLDALREVEYLKSGKNIEIIDEINSNILVEVDSDVLKRIFINVLNNALKFSHAGETITLSDNLNNNPNTLIIRIKDEGDGIRPEHINGIFNKFSDISNGVKSGFRSTGLGLTFCKMAIEAHNGKISAESVYKEGTTIIIELNEYQLAENPYKEEDLAGNYINLLPEDVEVLKEVKSKLAGYTVNDVSSIWQVLKDIRKNNSLQLNKWANRLESVVFNCNQEEYNKMIND